jgi:hypothetical protein
VNADGTYPSGVEEALDLLGRDDLIFCRDQPKIVMNSMISHMGMGSYPLSV